jgi:hypothetical protein
LNRGLLPARSRRDKLEGGTRLSGDGADPLSRSSSGPSGRNCTLDHGRQGVMGEEPGQSLKGVVRPAARSASRGSSGLPDPWAFRPRDGAADGLSTLLAVPMALDEIPMGIERRLPRRAEVLWNRLRGEAAMPPAAAAGALLAPPFSTQALLVTRPLRGNPQIAYAGSDMPHLGPAEIGPAMADARPTAPIARRLTALALSAIAAGAPRHLDSDFDPDTAGPQPGILFRAVALPLAPAGADGLAGLAVAVLSWRKLLSATETAALHSELRAAVSWMGSTTRGGITG